MTATGSHIWGWGLVVDMLTLLSEPIRYENYGHGTAIASKIHSGKRMEKSVLGDHYSLGMGSLCNRNGGNY